jgi:hypothetical protein
MPTMRIRQLHLSRALVPALLAFGLLAFGVKDSLEAHHGGPGGGDPCRPVWGGYSSAPAMICTSPVGYCTEGDLWGWLRGDYGFIMNTSVSAADPTVPGVFFYTGRSVMDLDSGDQLLGTDTGTVDLSPVGTAKMAGLITITGGAGRFAGAPGHLVLNGNLDFVTGEVTGTYLGEVCRAQ